MNDLMLSWGAGTTLTWGERLTKVMAENNLTQAQVADALGVSRSTVLRWQRGASIEWENLNALATLLDVCWIWLRHGPDAQKKVMDTVLMADPAKLQAAIAPATKEAQATNEMLRLALEAGDFGIWKMDFKTEEVYWDDVSNHMFTGLAQERRFPYHRFKYFIHEEDWPGTEQKYKDAIAGKKSLCHCRYRVTLKREPIKLIEAWGRIVRDDLGRPLIAVGLHHDVTPWGLE